MLPGAITSTDVREYQTTVLVNGIERPVSAWSADRELTGDLPQAVASVGAVTQATGSIDWAPSWAEHVGEIPANPMNPSTGWVPQSGERVQIYVTIDGTSYPRFTGRIDDTTGSLAGGMSSTLVDDIDNLSAEYSQPSIWDFMPPLVAGDEYRRVKASPMHTLVAAAMAAGYYNRRRPVGDVRLLAPLQGGTYPITGELTASEDGSLSNGYPTFHDTGDNGWVCADATAVYAPSTPALDTEILQLSLYVDPTHAAPARLEVEYATSGSHTLRVTGSRLIEVRENETVVASLQMGAEDRTAVARWDGTSLSVATESGGLAATGTARSGAMVEARVIANIGARISNAYVTVPAASDPFVHPDEPNAVFDCSETFVCNGGAVLRGIESSTARDVLDEISKALLLAIHLDMTGRLVIRSSDRITGAQVAATITTVDDILDAEWETNLLSHRSRVRVTADVPVFALSTYHNVKLHQSGEDQLNSGSDWTELIEPAADEEWWIAPPTEGNESQAAAINTGRGSWVGASITSDDGDTWSWGNPYYTGAFEQIAGRTWAIRHQAGTLPAGTYLMTRTSENSTTALWPAYQGMALPILRGSKIKFYDGSVRLAAGPTGGTLDHEMHHWHNGRRFGMGTSTVQTIAEHIRDYVTAPNPELKQIQIVPDPRFELADLLKADADSHGFTATGPCVGISEGASADGYDMSIHLRVTTIETTWTTYRAFNESTGANLTYAEFNQLTTGTETYTEFNADMEA